MDINNVNIVVDDAVLYWGDFGDLSGTGMDNILETIKGKELGVAKGSLKFEAKPEIRNIEHAGSLERDEVNWQRIIKWDVTAETTILDFNGNVLNASLIEKTESASTEFDVYAPIKDFKSTNYKDLIVVGKKHNSEKPVIVHVFNSYNPEGVSFECKDKDEAGISMKFKGCYKTDKHPFEIAFPKVA